MAYQTKGTPAVAGKSVLPTVDESDPRIQRLVEEIESQIKEAGFSPVKAATAISSVFALAFIFIGLLTLIGRLHIGFLTGPDWFIVGLMAFMGPVGIIRGREDRRIREIEERLPDFLRDVAEGGRFGMTLAKSIVSASKGKYGKLTPEIRRMASQIQWGVSATEALALFSERVQTPLVNRTAALIIKASTAGGNVADVLELVATDTKDMHLIQKERRASMAAYTSVIYIAFGVFLVTVLILQSTFLAQMQAVGEQTSALQATQGGQGLPGGGVQGATISAALIPAIKDVYFYAAIVHAIGDGVLAGVIQAGKFSAGLLHAFVMTLGAFLTLRVLAG
jgi:archaeal flagellar protein FlaJ